MGVTDARILINRLFEMMTGPDIENLDYHATGTPDERAGTKVVKYEGGIGGPDMFSDTADTFIIELANGEQYTVSVDKIPASDPYEFEAHDFDWFDPTE